MVGAIGLLVDGQGTAIERLGLLPFGGVVV